MLQIILTLLVYQFMGHLLDVRPELGDFMENFPSVVMNEGADKSSDHYKELLLLPPPLLLLYFIIIIF